MALISMVAADVFKWVAYGPCVIRRFHGQNNQGATVFIQFHQTPPVSTTTNVPTNTVPAVKSFGVFANLPFDYPHEDISLSECTICLSSDETKLVPVAAAGGLDMTVEVDSVCLVNTELVAGDLTSGLDSGEAYLDLVANAGSRVIRVDYVNSDGAARWLQLFTVDNPATGAVPIQQWGGVSAAGVVGGVPNGDTLSLFFGPDGLRCFSQDSQVIAGLHTGSTGGASHYAANFYQSSTAGTLTPTVSSVSKMRIVYRP
jgi:hypothetical protein